MNRKQDLRILLVEDSDAFREAVIEHLGVYNDIEGVVDLAAAREALQRNSYEVVILDKNLPDGSGLSLIPEIKAENPNSVVIVVTADSDFNLVKKCMLAGADDYVVKTDKVVADLLVRIPVAVSRAAATRKLSNLEEQVRQAFKYEIVGKSLPTTELRGAILANKGAKSHVLITGDSGTGKELVARRLHAIEEDSNRPFVVINCAAIPENLVESELFGHKKGAFTGAISDKPGKFELAHNGDIFLDEIGELPLQIQAKLLRVIQDGEFFRIGGTKPVQVSCRIIAATNQPLEEMVAKKRFRADLYYRLNVVRLQTSSLRVRKEDIPNLAEFFCNQIGGANLTIGERAIKRLTQHDWPGNIRELRNMIERAALSARARKSKQIDSEDIVIDQAVDGPDSAIRKIAGAFPTELGDLTEKNYQDYMEIAEREYLRAAVELCNGNAEDVATRVNIGRSTIFKRLSQFGLTRRPQQSKNEAALEEQA